MTTLGLHQQKLSPTALTAVSVVFGALLLALTVAYSARVDSMLKAGVSNTLSSLPNTIIRREQAQQQFIQEIFPKISQWDTALLKPYLDDATKLATTDEEFNSVLSTLSAKLGELRFYGKPQHVSNTNPAQTTNSNSDVLARYEFVATYASATAKVNLVLADNGDQLRLHSMNFQVMDTPQ